MQLDEARIQYALNLELSSRGHLFTIPNISWSWLNWEADLISITKAHYMHEFEIKISKSDFEKDFSKRKHQIFKRDLTNTRNQNRVPNYFSYVAPINSIPICIPDYAGLIQVEKSNRYSTGIELIQIKKPRLLHNQKQSLTGIVAMLRTIAFKYWNLSSTLENYKIQKNLFKLEV